MSVSSRLGKVFVTLLLLLGMMELRNAYKSHIKAEVSLPKAYFQYAEVLKKQKGEAILDWPFCIVGGNSNYGLCPYWVQLSFAHSLSRFHEKKVIGHYYGRLYKNNIDTFLALGWKELLTSTARATSMPIAGVLKKDFGESIPYHDRMSRCFTKEEWDFFNSFYHKYDFAGIQLYEILIPNDCLQEFYYRYGNPIAKIDLPFYGRISFIPKNIKNTQ